MRHVPLLLSVAVAMTLPVFTAGAGELSNGAEFNGVEINGNRFNGNRFNGNRFNGVVIDGVGVDGVEVGTMSLAGMMIVGSYVDHPGSTCAHSQLSWGPALEPGCSKCVDIVAETMPSCVTGYWSWSCMFAAQNLCSFDSYDLVGATFGAETATGGNVTLRIDDVEIAPDPDPTTSENESDDVFMYTVTYKKGGYWTWSWWGGFKIVPVTWEPICDSSDYDGLYNKALVIQGEWADCAGPGCGGKTSDDGFTFACRDVGALAKCAERAGYKWWYTYEECQNFPLPLGVCRQQTLDDHYQACVRMLRADYCGNGVPHTVDGTRINVRDAYGVQVSDDLPTWGFEAQWRPDGAQCVAEGRFRGADPSDASLTIEEYVLAECSGRWDQFANTSVACGHDNWGVVGTDWTHVAYIANNSSALWNAPSRPSFGGSGAIAPP